MKRCGGVFIHGCLSLLLVACGDDGSGGASAGQNGDSEASGTTGTDPSASASASESGGGPTEGSGSATATSGTGPTTDPTTGPTSDSGSSTSDGTTTDASMTSSTGAPMTSSTGTETTGGSETTGAVSEGTTDTTGEPPATCGDGKIDPGEACDLGPDNGPDNGCSEACEILPTSCGVQQAEAELIPRPVDIIITIDNSGSMDQEIIGVQNNINVNFSSIIEASGLDYRVIMVSRHGSAASSDSVCIEAPLSGIPKGGCANPPSKPVNTEHFFHYSVEIASTNAWCQLLKTYNGSTKDDHNFAPMGWQTWLRPDAYKVFLVVSDDRVNCSHGGVTYNDSSVNAGQTAATNFDNAWRTLSPIHFGDSPENRNFKWYSIVGLNYNNPPDKPYTPMDAIVTTKCSSAQHHAPGHQAMSNLTGALRFPLCDTTKYDVIFQDIAASVIADAKIACEFNIPEAPPGKVLDKDSIVVDFAPEGQDPVVFMQVPSVDQCGPMSFYVSGDQVILCPEACTLAQNNKDAKISVEFTCEPLTPG
ncbi:MAG TPA: hypothetical protein VIK91_28510 [Nannocystis sp.]